MMHQAWLGRVAATAALLLMPQLGRAQESDIYVDANWLGPFEGSQSNPYKTITQAINAGLSSGDVVHIASGNYTASLGEYFPLPIDVSGVTFQGDGSGDTRPHIGGDVNTASSDVGALILIDATTADVEGIGIQNLYFVGEDYSGQDAPAAIEVRAYAGHSITGSGVSNCRFERAAMNLSGPDGRPTVLIRVGAYGEAGASTFSLNDCEIEPTRRGGVEVTFEPTSNVPAFGIVTIDDCEIHLSGTDDAEFGVLFGGGEDTIAHGGIHLIDTTIDSRESSTSSDGIVTGLDIWLNSTNDKVIFSQDCVVQGNLISGCVGDGVRVRTNIDGEYGQAEILFIGHQFFRNTIIENGGAGVHLDWNSGTGYILFQSYNNLIAENDCGFWFDSFVDGSEGTGLMLNDTIANNVNEAFIFDGNFSTGEGEPSPSSLSNLVVWGNNGGGSQFGGSGGGANWDPVADSGLKYSCWQNLSGNPLPNHNINSDPVFVDASSGDYDIDGTGSPPSPCIDAGYSIGNLPRTDIHNQDRTVNGDGQGGAEIDMGCDEFDP
jgi:hypothetical protein